MMGMKLCRTEALSSTRELRFVVRSISRDICCHAAAGGIPAGICNLTQLKGLLLSSNSLTGECCPAGCGGMSFPARFKSVTLYPGARPVLGAGHGCGTGPVSYGSILGD